MPSSTPDLPAPDKVSTILVCQLRQIGDVLLTTPAIELLAGRYPQARIHVLTEKKCQPMLENNPHIFRIWPLDKKALINPLRQIAYYREIGRQGIDIAIDFQQLPRCRAAMLWSGAKVRLSFPPPWYLRCLYSHWHKPNPDYAAAYKAGVLAPLGIVWNGQKPRLYLSRAERDEARLMLQTGGLVAKNFISLDVTHRHSTRRWPARHYAHLIDALAEALPDWGFFMPFGPGEEDYIRNLAGACRHSKRIVVPNCVLSLRQTAACMEQAVLHIGNCSAPRHMAVALDVPTFTTLGATSSGWTFPSPEHTHIMARAHMPMPCQPCNANTCSNNLACMEQLEPDLVFAKVMEHIRSLKLTDDSC